MKNISKFIFVTFYLCALVLASIITIRPEAPFFFYKLALDKQLIVKDSGFSYRYLLNISPRFFNFKGVSLCEDGVPLSISAGNIVTQQGLGSFNIAATSAGTHYLYFSSSDNSDPITNGRQYTLQIPFAFVTRMSGVLYLLLLLPIAAWYIITQSLKAASLSTAAPFQPREPATHKFFTRVALSLQSYLDSLWRQIRFEADYWKRLVTVSVLAAFLYVFMEWLFFVTMPSFMSVMSLGAKVEILFISAWAVSLVCIALVAVIIVVDCLTMALHIPGIARFWGLLIPTVILSALVLLLVDNFTYTIFKVGIISTSGVSRGVYTLVYILLVGFIYYRLMRLFGLKSTSGLVRPFAKGWLLTAIALFAISAGITIANFNFKGIQASGAKAAGSTVTKYPNIILLGSDGLNADNMSVYGYYRDTTPVLKELAQSSLVAENAFTNAANTAGSVISIMTSKLPTQTRLLYPPDILTGIDSFQHLPGILKNLGYRNVELGVPYYVDADNYNLQNSFDMVNNRTVDNGKLGSLAISLGFENESYFLTRLNGRISDRVLHLFFIRQMQNPYKFVTQPAANIDDETKINAAMAQFNQSPDPLFIHIHLLGTHGGYYSPGKRVFSAGESQIAPWLTDFYDDTLLGFDAIVGEVIERLKAIGQYDNTILIIYTDHNKEFRTDERIPLIIHFPGDDYAGNITWNVENMDISPTILDYLGLNEPSWMEGVSLLKENPNRRRLIFSTGTTKLKPNELDISALDPDLNKPPFYQFSYISVLDCQRLYTLDLTSYQWSSKDVSRYVNPCSQAELLSRDEIKRAAYLRLAEDRFDISSLP